MDWYRRAEDQGSYQFYRGLYEGQDCGSAGLVDLGADTEGGGDEEEEELEPAPELIPEKKGRGGPSKRTPKKK